VIVAPRYPTWRALALVVAAAAAGRVPAGRAQFSATTNLVRVYVSVNGPDGAPVRDLGRDDFAVEEDGTRRPITAFSSGELPLSLAVVVDRSFSMDGRPLDLARAGAAALLAALASTDRASLVALGSRVETLSPLGAPEAARAALAELTPWGTTPIGESVEAAVGALDGEGGRRAVALFTDGQGRYDTTDRERLLEQVRRRDILVYPVIVGRQSSPLLMDLADLSGGVAVRVQKTEGAALAGRHLAADLRSQYLVGYEPPASDGSERWRRIRVVVSAPGARVRARAGYYR
jgi:Ca-activated chloride channel family protein